MIHIHTSVRTNVTKGKNMVIKRLKSYEVLMDLSDNFVFNNPRVGVSKVKSFTPTLNS